jgi:hypothetical protein
MLATIQFRNFWLLVCSPLWAWKSYISGNKGLREFENRALMKIFGPEGGEIVEGWRKLRYEGLHNL